VQAGLPCGTILGLDEKRARSLARTGAFMRREAGSSRVAPQLLSEQSGRTDPAASRLVPQGSTGCGSGSSCRTAAKSIAIRRESAKLTKEHATLLQIEAI